MAAAARKLRRKQISALSGTLNYNMTLTVNVDFNLHQKTDPKVQQDFKGQGHYNKVKGQIKSHHDAAHLQPLTNVPTTHQLLTPYGF